MKVVKPLTIKEIEEFFAKRDSRETADDQLRRVLKFCRDNNATISLAPTAVSIEFGPKGNAGAPYQWVEYPDQSDIKKREAMTVLARWSH